MRKRRTRSHIIAKLSANHVERHILLCGYSCEPVLHDYGIDMLLHTYTPEGEVENETVGIQLKATDSLSLSRDGQSIPFSVDRADLEYWLEERYPVILIVYDAQDDVAFWVYVQDYFQKYLSKRALWMKNDSRSCLLKLPNMISNPLPATTLLEAQARVSSVGRRNSN